ncbi:glycosyltransferase [Sphingobacterium oryzagri]|uniref:Glycosyltransferase n=1 Tax=Sphingobacterium oryzagri TaxID=3025669 RepID=A0ABY7WFF8_9SPHI|nr:glycosyltransferase [Sphingobacterium sp. KACC 22765]WDF68358.1 glycosyltransferase [Sphingobacterium sp. KACC 22765]
MLSIIISSYQSKYFKSLEENLAQTCGIAYELIQIWNPGTKSIHEAYNEGIRQSQYPFLLFLHEDVRFESTEWGKDLIACFLADDSVGLVGLAGSKVKTKAPSGWYENGAENNIECIRQYDKGKLVSDFSVNLTDQSPETVVSIDGVFIAMRKSAGLTFDERLAGFHNYDLAISVAAKKDHWNIKVIKTIVLTHFSLGSFDRDWLCSAYTFYKLYHTYLPLKEDGAVYSKQLELDNIRLFYHKCFIHREWDIARYFLRDVWKKYPFKPTAFILLAKWILSKKPAPIRK